MLDKHLISQYTLIASHIYSLPALSYRNEGVTSQSDEALLPDILDNLLVIERLSIHAVKLDQQFLSGSLSKLQLQLDPALELLLLDLEAIAIGDADLNN